MASTLSEDGAPFASLDGLKAQAAPTLPRAPPRQLGRSPWLQQPASGWPKVESFPRSQHTGKAVAFAPRHAPQDLYFAFRGVRNEIEAPEGEGGGGGAAAAAHDTGPSLDRSNFVRLESEAAGGTPSTLFADTAPSASLDRLKAPAAPTRPGAPPEQLGGSPWPPGARLRLRQRQGCSHLQRVGAEPAWLRS